MSKKKVKDLQQGAIQAEPLPDLEDESTPSYPQYPPLLQGVRANMAKYPNSLLMTRVGNFYEFYFEHADECSRLLNIKLASRSSPRHPPVSMAGFPFWQLDRYLKILVQDLNRYVAISEEVMPVNNGKAKAGMPQFDRRVARVISPGTLIDEKFLDPYQNNFLLSVLVGENEGDKSTCIVSEPTTIGLAWIDLSTGDFFTQRMPLSTIGTALARIGAREIVMDENTPTSVKSEVQTLVGHHHDLITYHTTNTEFNSMSTWPGMDGVIELAAEEGFSSLEQHAGHQLLDYVNVRLPGLQLQLQPPRRREINQFLAIDRHSLRGLEILETSRDGLGKGSLLHAVRRTVTKGGARLLRDRLTAPSCSLSEIKDRLDLVESFYQQAMLRDLIIQRLRRIQDVQRIVQKFTLNKGDADDLVSLAKAIHETAGVHDILDEASRSATENEVSFQTLLQQFDLVGPAELGQEIFRCIDEEGLAQLHRQEEDESAEVAASAVDAIQAVAPEEVDSLPKNARIKARLAENRFTDGDMQEAWIMRRSASDTIARLHEDLDELQNEKLTLEHKLQKELGTDSVTLKWTPGMGHIAHVKSLAALNRAKETIKDRMVASSKNARSFYVTEWSSLGRRIDQARTYIRTEESRIFSHLRQHVIQNIVKLRRNAAIIDELDVASAFASLASEEGWTRPVLTTDVRHNIVGGRHPTVKLGLEEQGRSFVTNDLSLNEQEQIWLVTGPNMAGKSTFLRQSALITILAQVGSYVPAQFAEIGLVDQIFSRIGAADDLFRDQSTFMVEMLETSAILKQATKRSFVIMDEVGRGTTPQDGLAVAYGALHHLNNVNKSRTLFATHFHALADLTADWPQLGRYCTDITEDSSGSFSFQHKLRPGVNRQSHALKVAKLAGLPVAALQEAERVLHELHLDKGADHTTSDNVPELLAATA